MADHTIAGRDDITPEWLGQALTDAGYLDEPNVTAVEVSDIGVGRGYASQTVLLKPTYSGESPRAPQSMVGKIPNVVSYPEEMTQVMTRFFSTEVNWYTHASSTCPAHVPDHYLAEFKDLGHYVLLLEDLSQYGTFVQTEDMPDDIVRLIVSQLAAYHARWWLNDELNHMAWLSQPELLAEIQPLLQYGWPAFARFTESIDPDFSSLGERFVGQFSRISDVAATSGTMTHGDFRAENFLYDGKDDLVILDWQLSGHGTGLYDLGYFIGQSLSVEQRRRLETGLLDLYRAELAKGGAHITRDQLNYDYKWGLLGGLAIPMVAVQGIEDAKPAENSSDEDVAQFNAMMDAGRALQSVIAERAVRAVMDNDCASVLS